MSLRGHAEGGANGERQVAIRVGLTGSAGILAGVLPASGDRNLLAKMPALPVFQLQHSRYCMLAEMF